VTNRVELPGDHWAELRDPMDVTERERRPLKVAYGEFARSLSEQPADASGGGEVDDLIASGEAFERSSLVFCVTAWGGPRLDGVAISEEALDDIPAPVYTALSVAVAPIIKMMFPNPKASMSLA